MAGGVRNQKGMTLTEVVVAVALAAVVIMSILTTVAQHATLSRRIDKMYVCANLARKRMDDLKRLNFRDLEERGEETNVRVDEEGEPDAGGDYTRTTGVASDHSGNPYMAKVKVSVDKIIDGSATGSPVVIETIFADVE